MEKILTETTYDIPFNRWVDLGLSDYDPLEQILVQIKHPKGFEDYILKATIKKGGPAVAVNRRIGGKMLHPATRVDLKVFQIQVDKLSPVVKTDIRLNPNPIPPEERKSLLKTILSNPLRPKDWKATAMEQAQKRRNRLATIKAEVDESCALKPAQMDGKRILTADDCDYTRGVGIIEALRLLEDKHNKQAGLDSPSQRKLLCEFYDIISFSGIEVVIGLYIALGSRSKGKGDLGYLQNWYQTELSKIFSQTSLGSIQKKGLQVANGFKPKQLRRSPNPGFSIKQAAKIIGALFTDEFSGNPLRLSDLQCEVYQPIFFDDEQTRCYSIGETPTAKLVDVALNAGLDPLYFQSRQVDGMGVTLGPTRRSFDLPFGQHNNGITLVSVGADLTYQESEEGLEGLNPAQLAFLNKKKSYRLDYLDAKKYMQDHPGKVSYLRIETGNLYGAMANSISIKDLEASKLSAGRLKWWSNESKNVLEWS